ncbi:glycoside hydrolase family 15 protein [Tersicoccus sp. Bi-70]|uniref:glycoside hydrolase family 15 protein n=1 Tax=Tersicoccus sp. Bi-70 TaxID=1897634 RepID=UPI00097B11A6|nr:glycoside hydrolase family 15 protein [Tersicoccus sp. Bi-70]OMH32334.1 glycoside hydrolase family 15 [Tersicoccus sp. Bi-70]
MSTPIRDYAFLSDLHAGLLVSRHGSIDWLSFPRFDAPSFFSALLGDPHRSRWSLHAVGGTVRERRYLPGTFVLETVWETATGTARVTEFMPIDHPDELPRADVVRRIEALSGTVEFTEDLVIRFGYGRTVPWVRRVADPDGTPTLVAIGGPEALVLRQPDLPTGSDHHHRGTVRVTADGSAEGSTSTSAGASADGAHGRRQADLVLSWFHSHRPVPDRIDVDAALARTIGYWERWTESCTNTGAHDTWVRRSLLVLRALTHEATGGIVAAATTSLPEQLGGARNWDYRFCWLRDAALTLESMLDHGYAEEALHWRNWLLRAVAGDIADLQIVYGVAGERELGERELPHLEGYAGSPPVRIGNGAVDQYQADVVGEVMVALGKLRGVGVAEDEFSWSLQRELLRYAEHHLDRKDQGLWEMRGDEHYFTHSRVMMWAAFDQGVRAVHEHGMTGPAARWAKLRDQLHDEIMAKGFDEASNSFVQTYDGTEVDASLLQLPQVGFIGYHDPRMLGTVARIEQELRGKEGLVLRYRTEHSDDGLTPGEHPFLACSFWLVEQYAMTGRHDDAVALMDTVIACGNDLQLFSEEYDPDTERMVGNFPQAFSHLTLIRASDALGGYDPNRGRGHRHTLPAAP